MALLLSWLRIDLRGHWRSLLVLGVLVAIASCIVLASIAGARRGYSALDRLLDQTLPATLVFQPSDRIDLAILRGLPGVEAVSGFNGYTGFGVDEAPGETVNRYLPVDDEAMRTVERPVILAGRLADPGRADEAVITANFVKTFGLGVGDEVTLRLFTLEQVDSGVSGVPAARPPQPLGPTVPVRIVGIVRSSWFGDAVGSPGQLIPSAGLAAQGRYRENIHGVGPNPTLNALVRLREGPAGIAAFRAALDKRDKLHALPPYEVDDRADVTAHSREVVGFESGCLLVFGLCALLVGVALVGQSVARSAQNTVDGLASLHAVGMERRQLVAIAGVAPALVATAGMTVGVIGAFVVSTWLPFGAAASLEPAPGPHFDAVVLLVGWVLGPLLVYAGTSAVAFLLLFGSAADRDRQSSIAQATRRVGLPVWTQVGVRFALEASRFGNQVSVRPAVFGAALGVLGVVAATMFAAGVTDAAKRPERFGQRYHAMVGYGYNGNDLVRVPDVVKAVRSDPDVESLADTRFAAAGTGNVTVIAFALPVDEHALVVKSAGEPPRAVDEVMLAPKTARRLGADVGSSVRFAGNESSGELLVTGIGFVPETSYNAYDEGALLTPAGYEQLFGTFFINHLALVRFAPDAEPQVVLERLERRIATIQSGKYVYPSLVPQPKQLAEIRDVRLLPVGLGAFLGLFALSAVAHALGTAVRQRRRELAVLRALGMTPLQARGVLVAQAWVSVGVGVLVGLPLGIALGRGVWRIVAELMPLAYRSPNVVWVLVLCVPVAVLVASLLAAGPGHRAARLPVGQVLRAE